MDDQGIWEQVRKTYKLKQVIGEGSFGKVIEARHRETREKVAIKLIRNIQSS